MIPVLHPGWLMSSAFDLEIDTSSRQDLEGIIFSIDSFNLPELTTQTFEIVPGPGEPSLMFPGRPQFEALNLEVTNFYSHDVLDFLVKWYEGAKIDIVNNRHDGYIIGKDEEDVIRFRADVFGMWPMRISFGQKTRTRERQTVSVALSVFKLEVRDEDARREFDVAPNFYDLDPE